MSDIKYSEGVWLMCSGLQVNMLIIDLAIDISKIFKISNNQFISVDKDNINIHHSYWVKTIKSGTLDMSDIEISGDEINLSAEKEINIDIDDLKLTLTKDNLEILKNVLNESYNFKGEKGEKGETGKTGPCGKEGKNNYYVMFINNHNRDLFKKMMYNITRNDPNSIFLFKDKIAQTKLKNLDFNNGKVNISDLIN